MGFLREGGESFGFLFGRGEGIDIVDVVLVGDSFWRFGCSWDSFGATRYS